MKRLKSFLKKIFFLPPMPTVLIAIPSFIFVFVVLATGVHSIFTYFSYLLSAYALIITVTGMQGIVEAIRNRTCELSLVQKIRRTPFGSRLLGDAVFRSEITLHGGLFINLLHTCRSRHRSSLPSSCARGSRCSRSGSRRPSRGPAAGR